MRRFTFTLILQEGVKTTSKMLSQFAQGGDFHISNIQVKNATFGHVEITMYIGDKLALYEQVCQGVTTIHGRYVVSNCYRDSVSFVSNDDLIMLATIYSYKDYDNKMIRTPLRYILIEDIDDRWESLMNSSRWKNKKIANWG